MFRALKTVKRKDSKKPLLVDSEDGVTTNAEEQVKLITRYFKDFFNPKKELLDVKPTPMKKLFTTEDITGAINKLKNNKSPGIDEIRSEQLKYGPTSVATEIAHILDTAATEGDTPIELSLGIPTPHQKSGKKRYPCTNLRPIILLSAIRKTLAIYLINRMGDNIMDNAPIPQAAYQHNWSTREHVFAFKILAERAFTTVNNTTHILLIDMSKAFDTITDMRTIMDPDELHMIKVLMEGVQLCVRRGRETGERFTTNTGVSQRDCLSPVLFILYLAKAFSHQTELNDHNYHLKSPEPPPPTSTHLIDHAYNKPINSIIDAQYTDDTEWAVTGSKHVIENIRVRPIPLLGQRQLQNNATKDEYIIDRLSKDVSWKCCKILGRLLDTEEDVKRIKKLALDVMSAFQEVWRCNQTNRSLKIRISEALVQSIFLYNSEIWTMTSILTGQVNAFQRGMLRMVINIRWTDKISNDDLRATTKHTDWSDKIYERRFRRCGHLLRMSEDTPPRRALVKAKMDERGTKGRPNLTWLALVKQNLAKHEISWKRAKELAQDRVWWRFFKWRITEAMHPRVEVEG